MKNDKIRTANVMFNKNGNGFTTTRVSLPVPFVKALGITENDRLVIIELDDNKITIRKQN